VTIFRTFFLTAGQSRRRYGIDLRNYDAETLRQKGKINLQWIFEMYSAYPSKEKFFDFTQSKAMGDFNKVIGVRDLKEQIIRGASEEEIRKSWEPGLTNYKKMRTKYMLYP
jgi:uncharacterized protein YbbC (DUF1343 family)